MTVGRQPVWHRTRCFYAPSQYRYFSDARRPVNNVGSYARTWREKEQGNDRSRVQEESNLRLERIAEAEFMAAWATRCMLPWERAQMNKNETPLTSFEKFYWTVFPVLGIAGFVYEMRGSNNAFAKRFRKDKDLNATAEQTIPSRVSPDFDPLKKTW